MDSCRNQADISPMAVVLDKIDFNFHVRPILSDRCFSCHGPDEKARKGDLRLDREEDAFAALDSMSEIFAIVPGDPSHSLLVDRIESQDPEYIMPPPESNLILQDHEIKILKRWIKQGAQWKPHWAYINPQLDEELSFGESQPIDYFIHRKLMTEGLKPSATASREKLIRKLSFDLRGLPPTIEEIDNFISDQSENAYGQLVDRYLNSNQYAERMTMEWLDLSRYADSHGYQDDIERSMWPWRDWVIQSFNSNMPYDQFVTWQIAGDLMPESTYEQKLATGFNRNHKITQEVGVIDEEYRVTYVLDRTNTFATAFLGLTMECSQCHDHKFDPISQKEYFSLFSFFNQVDEKGRVDYGVEVAEPSLQLPVGQVDTIRNYIANLLDEKKQHVIKYAANKWKEGFTPPTQTSKAKWHTPSGLTAWYPLDYLEDESMNELTRGKTARSMNSLIPVPGKHGGAIEFMGINYANLMSNKPFDVNRPFSISFWIKSLDGGIRGPVVGTLSNNNESNFVLQVTNDKTLRLSMGDGVSSRKIDFSTKETLPANEWVQICLTHDGSLKERGLKFYMNGEPLNKYVYDDDARSPLPSLSHIYLGSKAPIKFKGDTINDPFGVPLNDSKGLMAGQLDEVMFFNRALNTREINDLVDFDPIDQILAKSSKSASDLNRLFHNDLLHNDDHYRSLLERFREAKIKEGRTEDIVIKPTMVMEDMDTIRTTFVLNRGQYDQHGDTVHAGTPEAILKFSAEYEPNRLGLAKWLFDPDNPLTARVAVNRYWQMIFGRGIVSSASDFGSQGTLPSHPELLDYLAIEFRESRWDVKKLIKSMVMSETYRQSTNTNKKLQHIDPDNILLARGPQSRLPAEMIRDHALAISGLMSKKVGGPSVKPYQPNGLWLEVASGNQALRKYIQDHDQDLYRRSLYTFWKRTLPPPSMTVFDAPSREQCTIQRRNTSTPMQALVLLNDPQFTEASRLIAARMIHEGGSSPGERIRYAIKLATSREAKAEEVAILVDLFESERSDFDANKMAADKLLAVGERSVETPGSAIEFAAYTVVANAILNMTETIMKG